MTTHKQPLAAILYHCAATRAIDFILDNHEDDATPARTASIRALQPQSIEHAEKRAAGGRA